MNQTKLTIQKQNEQCKNNERYKTKQNKTKNIKGDPTATPRPQSPPMPPTSGFYPPLHMVQGISSPDSSPYAALFTNQNQGDGYPEDPVPVETNKTRITHQSLTSSVSPPVCAGFFFINCLCESVCVSVLA